MSQKLDLPKGAAYVEDYISQAEHDRLMRMLDYRSWWPVESSQVTADSVQFFGKCNIRGMQKSNGEFIGTPPMPRNFSGKTWFSDLPFEPDQAVVWSYDPGSGFDDHIDPPELFSDFIAVLSLCGAAQIDFRYKDKHKDVLLEPRSLLILTGPSRYKWSHGMRPRKKDKKYDVTRSRRVSIVLRERNATLEK